jgi:fibronectin type III domain protein
MTDLDELIRAADPALGMNIPEPRWEHPRAVHPLPAAPARTRGGRVRVTGVRRGQPWLVAGLAAVAMGVLAAVLMSVVPGPAGPQSAAAAVLEEASAAAGQQPVLPPGQYWYAETQTQVHLGLYQYQGDSTGDTEVASAQEGQTDQAWTGNDGTGHHLVTLGARQYPSAADQATWATSGTSQNAFSTSWTDGGGQAQTQQSLMDVSGLPTDPGQLERVIAQQKLPIDDRFGPDLVQDGDAYHLDDGQPYSVFEGAAVLLIGPTAGMTPALASALFQVMADQPGVELLGTVTAHDGQSGAGIALPSADSTQVAEVIVDPDGGQLLEARFVLPPTTTPARNSCGGPAVATTTTCGPATGDFVSEAPWWTDVVARGVVGTATTTVPATGTVRPTATLVPGPPTDVVATAVPGGGIQLTWTAPADVGDGPVTDYVIERVDQQGRARTTSSQDTRSATTTYLWPDTDPNDPTFSVQAVNADGYGPASAPVTVSAVPATTPPASPSP